MFVIRHRIFIWEFDCARLIGTTRLSIKGPILLTIRLRTHYILCILLRQIKKYECASNTRYKIFCAFFKNIRNTRNTYYYTREIAHFLAEVCLRPRCSTSVYDYAYKVFLEARNIFPGLQKNIYTSILSILSLNYNFLPFFRLFSNNLSIFGTGETVIIVLVSYKYKILFTTLVTLFFLLLYVHNTKKFEISWTDKSEVDVNHNEVETQPPAPS